MFQRGPVLLHSLLGATALSLALPGCGWAQSSLEEIVVTARKREERLQNVPVAVTTLAGDQLQASGVRSTGDLTRFVPNLAANAHPASSSTVTFAIRGQTSGGTQPTVDRPVGVYADGVNISRIQGMNGAFFDLARVEVLNGPQGTLYGRNTTGGAVNLISRDADYHGVHGFVGVDVGNNMLFAPRFAINLPLIEDKLSVRLGAQGTWRRGFGESVTTGQRIGADRDQLVARATVVADPWEGVNLKGKAEFFRTRENGNLITAVGLTPGGVATIAAGYQLGLPNPTSAASRAIAADALAAQFTRSKDDYRRTFYEHPQHDNFNGQNFGLTATFDLSPDVKLKSITGYRHFTNNVLTDLDGTSFRLLSVGLGRFPDGPLVQAAPGLPPTAFQSDPGPEQSNRFFSQEFNLSGTAFGDRLSWLGGFYYSNEVSSYTQEVQALPPLVTVAGAPVANIFDGSKIYNGSWSLYTQEEFKLTNKLKIQGGVRFTEERKFLNSESRNFNPANNTITCLTGVPGVFPANNPGACHTHNEKSWTGWSWMAGASYQATDDVLVYTHVARGFKGGAFQFSQPTLAPANPEYAREVEVGLKSDWFDRRLRVNLAAFNTDYTNKQETTNVTTPQGVPATVIQNAAKAVLRGFEGEFVARPVDALTLKATVGYLWGKYDSFPGALRVNGGAPVDASGERFSQPPWTYSLGGRYEATVGEGTLGVQADWSWTAGANPSARLINPAIPADLVNRLVALCIGSCTNGRASVGLLSGSMDYTVEDAGLKVGLFVTNLLNKKYQIAGPDPSSQGGIITAISTEPRMFGLTIRKTFGED
ncbi:TonB-dependent receptor [Phenylobacterium sp. LjRoot219]|uniref:TonB-dependent receptor n=1 Tax=Phenylobacterium sp. LjRoot219 TaxID=3342283 RepID=UPI003ECE4CA5